MSTPSGSSGYGALSLAFLVFAIGLTAYLALGRQSLPFNTMFAIQAAAIVLLWIQFRRLKRQKGVKWVQSVPAGTRLVLSMIAAAGFAVTVMEVASLLATKTPAGDLVSSVKWNRSGDLCRVTYNNDVRVQRPLTECDELDRSISLAFGGGWILVGAIGVWVAFLRAGESSAPAR